MGHKMETDEMSRHRHYCGELSFQKEEKTRDAQHKPTTSSSSPIMLIQEKKKKKKIKERGTIYNRTTELRRLQNKKWLGDNSQYSHIFTQLALVSLTYFFFFSRCTEKKTQKTWRNAQSSDRLKEIWSWILIVLLTQPTLFSTVQPIGQIHREQPWRLLRKRVLHEGERALSNSVLSLFLFSPSVESPCVIASPCSHFI